MSELPFQSPNESLKAVIRHSYIKPLVIWLLGNRQDQILAQESNSNWESALTLDFFIEAIDIFRKYHEEEEICQSIETICPKIARWLISNRIDISEEYCCWDHVTWDTSVVIRVLLNCLKRFRSDFNRQEINTILRNARKSVKWLNHRFMSWDQEVKYPFGPADVAQILITGQFIKKNYPRLFRSQSMILNTLHKSIVIYLLEEASQNVDIRIEDGSIEKSTWWGDYFQTAEVLESLAIYYDDLKNSKNKEEKDLKIRVEKAIFYTCKYIESTQKDGLWGTHVDTIRTLYTYIKVCWLVPKVICQSHLVFKALRWICDEKQRFQDGSFLHTMFLTIFMAPALVTVHNEWPQSTKSVLEIYDEALWYSPILAGVERLRRFDAETKISDLEEKLERFKKSTLSRGKWVKSIVLTMLMLGLFVFLGFLYNALKISVSIEDKAINLLILTIVFGVYIAVQVAIWKK